MIIYRKIRNPKQPVQICWNCHCIVPQELDECPHCKANLDDKRQNG